MAQLSFDLSGIVGQQPRTRADDVRAMFEPYNRTMQQYQMAKNDVSRVAGAPRLQMLQEAATGLKRDNDALAARLRTQQQQYLTALNTQRTAAIKANARGGPRGPDFKAATEAFKAAGQLISENPIADFAQSMGVLDASLAPVAAALATNPDVVEGLRQNQKVSLAKLQLSDEDSQAISKSRLGYFGNEAPKPELARAKKISDAVGLFNATVELSQGVTSEQREAFRSGIADFYGLNAEDVSAERLESVRRDVQKYAQDVQKDPTERKALQDIGFAAMGLDPGGAPRAGVGGGARVKVPDIPRLPAGQQMALEKFLTALSDDGIARVGEETGMGYRLTQADIDAGRAAYAEAKRLRAYTPEQAPFFSDQFLAKMRQYATGMEGVARQQDVVLNQYEMDSVQRGQLMAQQFLDAQNAAEGLRVPLAYEAYDTAFERDVMGEMMDIVRKEGEKVFDTGSLPTDRERRLGGRGSAARAPHRFAKQLYSMDQSRPIPPSDVIPLINKRFRDPRDQERALAYFFAMKEVDAIRADTRRPVQPMQPGEVAQQGETAMQEVQRIPPFVQAMMDAEAVSSPAPLAVSQAPRDYSVDPYFETRDATRFDEAQMVDGARSALRFDETQMADGSAPIVGYETVLDQPTPAPVVGGESVPVGVPRTEQRFDETRLLEGAMPIIGQESVIEPQASVYLTPRAFYLNDIGGPQPFGAQARAPLVGPAGSRNYGMPQKLV
jgi:hypothetical protein